METVATTLTLAEQNHAEELKRVCLEFASRNLSTVMCSEGYHHMISSCPQLQVQTLLWHLLTRPHYSRLDTCTYTFACIAALLCGVMSCTWVESSFAPGVHGVVIAGQYDMRER